MEGIVEQRKHFDREGFLYFFMTEIKWLIASFCLGERVRQASNIVCCSSVNSTMLPSAKNWASVMPKPLQIIPNVATNRKLKKAISRR